MILPDVPGVAPEAVVGRYLDRLGRDPGLRSLVDPHRPLRFPTGSLERFRPSQAGGRPAFAVIANDLDDMFLRSQGSEDATEIYRIREQLARAGAEVYVLPLGAELATDPGTEVSFRREVATGFDALLAPGGDDLHPATYGRAAEVPNLSGLNLKRDRLEIGMIGEFIRAEHGVFYGICRGHQACAVSQGFTLVQDIPTQTPAVLSHRDDFHPVEVSPGSLHERALGRPRVQVYSYHHQAVEDGAGSALRATVRSADPAAPLIEGLEHPNGLVLTVQYHPEYMDTQAGRRTMRFFVSHAVEARDHRFRAPPAHASRGCLRDALARIIAGR
jgi:putative glutamine amidotransferase